MKKQEKKNWHVLHYGELHTSWLTETEAKEIRDRHLRCFPDEEYEITQMDNIKDYPIDPDRRQFYPYA